MPSLKEYVLTRYARMLASRIDSEVVSVGVEACDAPSAKSKSTQTGANEDMRYLLALLEDRARLIERLKTTDERRKTIHESLKKRWRIKQAEAAGMRGELHVLRKLLRRRRHVIRELLERFRHAKAIISSNYASPGLFPLEDASPGPPGGLSGSIIRRSLAWFPTLVNCIWNHWMRLGVLRQYEARPLRLDRIPASCVDPGMLPKISIVTPSFNQARYLGETMRSVLEQGYPQLEYIVMDGGSVDGSVEIVKKHEGKLAHWQSASDKGQADAIRLGLDRATGEIMAWLNSDDLFMPGVLSFVGEYFMKHPDVDVVYGHRIIVNANTHEVGRWVLPRHDDELLLWADFIPQETMFWRRQIYEKVGGMDASFQFALDWDLLLRFQKAGARMVRLPYFLGAFRIHSEQKNAVTINTAGYQEMKLLRDRELGKEFNRGGLAKRVNRAQFRALILTWLLRLGVRF